MAGRPSPPGSERHQLIRLQAECEQLRKERDAAVFALEALMRVIVNGTFDQRESGDARDR